MIEGTALIKNAHLGWNLRYWDSDNSVKYEVNKAPTLEIMRTFLVKIKNVKSNLVKCVI